MLFSILVPVAQQKKLCGHCSNPYEKDSDEDWFRCKGCKQWYHRECLDLDESACEDQFFVFNSCQKCEIKAGEESDEIEIEGENGIESEIEDNSDDQGDGNDDEGESNSDESTDCDSESETESETESDTEDDSESG